MEVRVTVVVAVVVRVAVAVAVRVTVGVLVEVAGGWQVGPATVEVVVLVPIFRATLLALVALAQVAVKVTVSVTGSELSLRLSTLIAPVALSISIGGVAPAACAVALLTWLAVQQPENTAFEISLPGLGLLPLTVQA
jgi:hypothetical protein